MIETQVARRHSPRLDLCYYSSPFLYTYLPKISILNIYMSVLKNFNMNIKCHLGYCVPSLSDTAHYP